MYAKGKIDGIDCNIMTTTEHKVIWEGYNSFTMKEEARYEWVINGHADFDEPRNVDFHNEYRDFEGMVQMPIIETELETEPQYIKASIGLLGIQYNNDGMAVSCDFIVSGKPEVVENHPDLPTNIWPMVSREMRERETMFGLRYIDTP